MSEPRPPAPATLQMARERTIETLCRHFASDHLTVEEFESRVDAAHRARNADELGGLISALPALDDGTVRPTATPMAAPASPAPIDRPERGYAIAILGGASRKGRWVPPDQMFAFATCGGVELDFRTAVMPPGVTEITVFALMGGVEIIVPPELAVESAGVAILGGFDQNDNAAVGHAPDAPVLRIRGFALMGGLSIQVRQPGESARDARRRERQERRIQKDERRRALRGQ